MYDNVIPVMRHGLTAMSAIVTKAEANCEARKIDPSVMLSQRLAPDMFTLTRQIQIATDHARRAPARLCDKEAPSAPDVETTFAELQARIAATITYLDSFAQADFDGAATREITLTFPSREVKFLGLQYLTLYALPNFYFHLTTAYNILRHNGVEIGKRDFIGS